MNDERAEDGKIRVFTDLEVWQKGHKLVINLYGLVKKFPREEKYTLVSQTIRAAGSITANIAEGFSRYYFKDKARFYYNSRGSLSELQNHLIVAKDLQYISREEFQDLYRFTNEIRRLLNGLIRATQKRK